MTDRGLRLLMVEDSEEDAELIRIELERGGFRMDWERVYTEDDFLAALDRREWDLIISDFQMPEFDGIRAFTLYQRHGLDTPFIFVSGEIGEERAVEAMRAGARDYVLKDNLARLNVAVKRELREAENRKKRRAAEEATQREQRRLAMAVEASGSGVFEHRVPIESSLYVSDRVASIIGCELGDIPIDRIRGWIRERLHPEHAPALETAYLDFLQGRTERHHAEVQVRHADGRWIQVTSFAKAVERDSAGRATHVVGVILDVSDLRKLEAQLLQAQKMEAIGRLAGGVAHDFNNLLTAILSFGSMVLSELVPGDPVHQDMNEVLKAARRAEALTGQLLAFSRRKTISPRVVNPNTLVTDTDRMLRRLLGEDIELRVGLAHDLWNVRIDPSAFEQVLINLAINSRDAMPSGGKLVIETRNVVTDEGNELVGVSVSDNGIGMDRATQSRMFEPFFTTKEPGKGTGLGLSTCYGIVNQAGGHISVESEVGAGTTFRIFLPRVARAADPKHERPAPASLSGSETILVTEDDDQVRKLTVRALKRRGYRVLEAPDAGEALRICEADTAPIDLLITDVIMPGLSGSQLAEKVATIRPEMKVLFMSGYSESSILDRLDPGKHIVQKPFTPDILVQAVREVLDRP